MENQPPSFSRAFLRDPFGQQNHPFADRRLYRSQVDRSEAGSREGLLPSRQDGSIRDDVTDISLDIRPTRNIYSRDDDVIDNNDIIPRTLSISGARTEPFEQPHLPYDHVTGDVRDTRPTRHIYDRETTTDIGSKILSRPLSTSDSRSDIEQPGPSGVRALFRAPFGRQYHPFHDQHLYSSQLDGRSSHGGLTASRRTHSPSESTSDRFQSSSEHSSENTWKYRRRRWKCFYIITATILILLMVITALAIVIGLQGVQESQSAQTSSNTLTFQGQLTLSNVTYSPKLEQKNSSEFQALAQQFCGDGIRQAVDKSDELTQKVAGCTVNSFSRASDGSVIADFSIEVNDASLANTRRSAAARLVEQVLQTAISRSQTVNGYNDFLRQKTLMEDSNSVRIEAPPSEGSGDVG